MYPSVGIGQMVMIGLNNLQNFLNKYIGYIGFLSLTDMNSILEPVSAAFLCLPIATLANGCGMNLCSADC